MCTAISFKTKHHYFGRNLDMEFSYNEKITITPRGYLFSSGRTPDFRNKYAIIGMAYVLDNYPLYYEATNEKGLSMAGLNFPGFAYYESPKQSRNNIASFELIPWILGNASTVSEAKKLFENINITNTSFRDELLPTPLHWIVSDGSSSVTVESLLSGIRIYDNTVGVLTNSPSFDMQMFNLNNYMSVTKGQPVNRFAKDLELVAYSYGMGGISLPGDYSSMSRFVKASFVKLNSISGDSERESVTQFFHILGSVSQPRGATMVREDKYEITRYASCCNTDKGIYYYITYDNSSIIGIDMNAHNLDSGELIVYDVINEQQIRMDDRYEICNTKSCEGISKGK